MKTLTAWISLLVALFCLGNAFAEQVKAHRYARDSRVETAVVSVGCRSARSTPKKLSLLGVDV